MGRTMEGRKTIAVAFSLITTSAAIRTEADSISAGAPGLSLWFGPWIGREVDLVFLPWGG